ncbi:MULTISPECIES: hypothetical protein [unclassified Mannheimia]|uniref:hypothetical protein n=1 Tax=unclassified Mannheimia TaxID=2645054 RepID=UPI00359D043E
MIFIQNKLENLYLNPRNHIFKAVNIIKFKQKTIQFSLFFILIILPVLYIGNTHLDINRLLESIENQNTHLAVQKNVYHSLFDKAKSQSSENNLTSVNTAIQKIAQKHHLNIDNLSWNLEQGKSIELKITANSHSLFNFINDLNQIDYLKYHFLTLTKSTEDRKVELTTTLVVLTNKE